MKAEQYQLDNTVCLKTKPFEETRLAQEEAPSEYMDEERFILCRDCGNPITSLRYKTFVDGKHSHIFANPYGMVFEIVCFSRADGCAPASRPSEEFSWFKNHTWQVSVCKLCLNHNGWIFESFGGIFFGLIIDQLIYP